MADARSFVCLPSGFIQNAAPVQMHKKYARADHFWSFMALLLLSLSPFIMLDVHIVLSWVCFLSRAIWQRALQLTHDFWWRAFITKAPSYSSNLSVICDAEAAASRVIFSHMMKGKRKNFKLFKTCVKLQLWETFYNCSCVEISIKNDQKSKFLLVLKIIKSLLPYYQIQLNISHHVPIILQL